jgi:hypothetical protein
MEWNRGQYGNDLVQLGKLVEKFDSHKIFKNLNSILNIAQGKLCVPSGEVLSIETNGIELILKKKISGTIPHDLDSITIFLEIKSEFDLSKDGNLQDRILNTYSFQMEIKGINSHGEHYNAWHLDKDIRKEDDKAQKYDHPLYHFQPGGNKLENKLFSGAVFIGAPRFPHPPMDVVLGLHFVLKNFCSTKDYPYFTKLFRDPSYEDILGRARKRLFEPYFKAFSEDNTHEDFTMKNVFPMAV